MGIALDDDEEGAFLAAAHTGIFTTLRRDGWPVSLPVWFVALDGAVYLRTPAGSTKVARVRNDDRATFLVESGEAWRELKAVLWLGHAREVDDEVLLERVRVAMGQKYAGARTERAAIPDATKQHYGHRDVVFELRPDERRITWDNAKLRLRTATGG